jgi:predicted RNA binding protein YcfA (HicA-like mRNA interferase family)
MSKPPSIRAREVVRVAESIGFVFDRQRGSHAVYYRASDPRRIVIPMHGTKDLKPGTLPAGSSMTWGSASMSSLNCSEHISCYRQRQEKSDARRIVAASKTTCIDTLCALWRNGREKPQMNTDEHG